jgi:hypothetical protein
MINDSLGRMHLYLYILLLSQYVASETSESNSILLRVSHADIPVPTFTEAVHATLHETPLRRTKRHFFRDHISSSATSTMNVFVVTATLYNNERTDTPDAGSSTAEKARTVDDNSPADSLARQDVLRNTLIGVLGLLFSAGSLIVAVQHNRRNECRQRDLEASPDSNGHTELAGLRPLDGEGGTQRRGQLPPLERNSRLPARHTNLKRAQSQAEMFELDGVETQCGEPTT